MTFISIRVNTSQIKKVLKIDPPLLEHYPRDSHSEGFLSEYGKGNKRKCS